MKDKLSEFISYVSKNVFPIPPQYHKKPSAKLCQHTKKCQCELAFDKVYELHEKY